MSLIIVGPPQSSYVRTVRMVCAENNLAHRLEPVELGTDAHRKLHPWSRVPVLRDGSVEIYETSAIVRYLEDKQPTSRLIPSDPVARAHMEQWISAINSYVYDHVIRKYALAGYILPKLRNTEPDRAAVEASLPELRRDLELLDAGYARSEFLAGAELSLADLFVAPIIATIGMLPEGQATLATTKHLARAFDTVRKRPSFAVAHAELM